MTTHNDTPNSCLPYSKSKPLTPNRSSISPSNNFWFNYMISLQLNHLTYTWLNNKYAYYIPMMTRYYPRKHLPRTSHSNRPKRPPLRNNPFYYLRSLIFHWILLSILPLKPCPNPRTRWLLTPNRHSSTQSP